MEQHKWNFLVLIVSCIFLVRVNGQSNTDCRPGFVTDLRLVENGTLSWASPSNEICEIAAYIVSISILGTDPQWTYTVTEKSLDVGHLTPCVRYYFQVSQITAYNVTGTAATMNIVTPPPSDANLALDDVQYVPNGRHVELRWSLEEQWASCAQRYRVVILNEDTSVASDLYTTSTSVTLINLIPCGAYMFTVRALFTLEEEGPVSVVRHVVDPAATTRPTLESFTLGTNSIALTMQLQALAQNRCPIYNVEVKSPSFTATYLVTDQNSRTSFPLSITGLQPNTMYYVQISANNTVGATSPFQAAFQTLESS